MEKTFTKAIDILYLAKQSDVDIILNGDNLQLRVAEHTAIDKGLLEEVRTNKKLIVDFLSNNNWKLKTFLDSNKINSFNRDTVTNIPLSFSQERLWFIDRLEGSLAYHLPAVLRLRGKLDKGALSKALQAIIERHEILRTVYQEEDGQVYQVVKPAGDWKLGEHEAGHYQADQSGLEGYLQELTRAPFELEEDYMFRADVLKLGAEDHILAVTLHHIASDASSMPVLIGEVATLYSSYTAGSPSPLAPLPLQYADYAVWQREHVQEDLLTAKLGYWKEKLTGVAPLQLPVDDGIRAGDKGAAVYFEIGAALSGQLQALSQAHGATLYMTLLAAFKVLLYRYSGQEDICVGTSVAGRNQQELEGLIGFFVNTLALRDEVRGDMPFSALLAGVKETTLSAYAHQDVPFEKVVEAVLKERVSGRNPLFQVMLVLINTPEVPELKLGALELSDYGQEETTAKFDLTFFVKETKAGLQVAVQYDPGLYSSTRINRMATHFRELLSSAVRTPDKLIGQLELINAGERRELLAYGHSTDSYPVTETLVSLFEARAALHPDRVAVAFAGSSLSYKELNERAGHVAAALRALGVKEDTLVPLYAERGLELLTGILGILKSGGAYVPIDPDHPEDRISYMLEDTGALVAVSSRANAGRLRSCSRGYLEVVAVDGPVAAKEPAALPDVSLSLRPDHLAYVIYTSGSTGKPKGVQVSHRNVVDYIYGLEARTGISSSEGYALVSTISTDLGNTVLYSSLLLGGTLHVFSKETVSHTEALHAYFKAHRIDCLKIVPSHWKALTLDSGRPLLPLRLLIFGGESLPAEAVNQVRYYDPGCRVVNHYGPTETTIGKLLYQAGPEGYSGVRVPVGRPFSATQVYILSKEGQLCPVGVPGQLYIGGSGLARGYLNLPELTKEKFIRDPFSADPKALMYQTGDLVVYLEDGNIVFIGRTDDQVKIRGYRVEPGEIGRLLEESEEVLQAVVISREDKQGDRQLVGYVVPRGNFDQQSIREYLQGQLPDYMVPAYIVGIGALPLTLNGKVDRRALPDPEGSVAEAQYTSPETATEQKLSEIWQEVLEVEKVGLTDDFFELGGHSLLAIRLISAVRKGFSVELAINEVFEHPTVRGLAGRLTGEGMAESVLPPVRVVSPRPARVPLSFSQERLWFIDQLQGSTQYHVPAVLRLRGDLNPVMLAETLRTVIRRHEVLRTVVLQEEGRGYQSLLGAEGWELGLTEAGGKTEAEIKAMVTAQISAPFDLSQDYMLRAGLLRQSGEDHVLVCAFHHIASDGWSRSILVAEIIAIYSALSQGEEIRIGSPSVQYADYAIWQRGYLQGTLLEEKLGYWKEKLTGVAPLQLPVDDGIRAGDKGAAVYFEIGAALSGQLQALSQAHGATLYMTLLAAFKVLLYRYSGQEDICVGTSVAGRNQQELEGLIGFFVNTLALRDEVRGDMPFSALLAGVKETTLSAYAHQDVPFEKVVEAVLKERVSGRNPLFQVMLVLINTPEVPELKLGALELSDYGQEETTAKFDLTFFVKETKAGLQVAVQYDPGLYSSTRINRMATHFRELLSSAVRTPDKLIGQLELINAGERRELLAYGHSTDSYPVTETLVSLFEARAALHPDRVAVAFAGSSLSYKELNERAGHVAAALRALGVKEDTLVPLYAERGLELLTGILGILKSGGAYVPIDPDHPEDRISYMLEDTGALVAVSSRANAGRLRSCSRGYLEVVAVDGPVAAKEPAALPDVSLSLRPDHLAYVIYTSGSTGKPKGVQVSHRNVVDYIYGLEARTGISSSEGYALVSTISTDLGNTVLYSSLLLGGTLHVFSKETVSHTEALHAYFKAHRIDCLKIVPSHWKALTLDSGRPLLPLRLLIFGGESLPAEAVNQVRYYDPGCRVVNHYGPTETTIGKLLYQAGPEGYSGVRVPVGRPFSATQVYILSKEGQLCPVGVPGQLYIGGSGLARGYLNLPELTKEKFIRDPFSADPKALMYQTGDLVVYLEDGNIVFIGRTDDQVKIRGYRVEPGEIGRLLEESEEVLQAVVISREDKQGDRQLVGYVVPRGNFDQQSIREYLQGQLPDYMVPAYIVGIGALPLTLNGKVDRRALPDPEGSVAEAQYTSPETATEQKLSEIWQEVLEVEKVGLTDDFFELGGHSLLAIRLISAIWKGFGVELQINDIFLYPTISNLINHLKSHDKTPSKLLIPLQNSGKKIPLYMVCGTGGTILKFVNFVKMLNPDQPVFGLQQPTDINDLEQFTDTAEGIAKLYVNEILKQNPFGPYALSGHCFGGSIAFEMAIQLKAMGKKVVMLTMFDTYPTEERETTPASLNNYYQLPSILNTVFAKVSLKLQFEIFLLLKHPKQFFSYKTDKIKLKMGFDGIEPGNTEMNSFNNVSKVFKKASNNYRTTHYDGDIVAFYAKDKFYFIDREKKILYKKRINISDERKNSWKKYAKSVEIHEIEGDHSVIFAPKYATGLAKILQSRLDNINKVL